MPVAPDHFSLEPLPARLLLQQRRASAPSLVSIALPGQRACFVALRLVYSALARATAIPRARFLTTTLRLALHARIVRLPPRRPPAFGPDSLLRVCAAFWQFRWHRAGCRAST